MRFWALILMMSSPVLAEYTVTYGLEMEFSSRSFANFIHHFDMDDLQKKKGDKAPLPESVCNDYLLNPQAYEALPLDLKLKLSGGLAAPKIEMEQVDLVQPESRTLLGPDGKEMRGRGKKLLGIDGEVFSPEIQAKPLAIEIPKNDEARAFAEQVQRAWRNLSLEEKRAVVHYKHLPRRIQAELALRFENLRGASTPQVLKLRADAPADVRALFKKLKWHRDQDGMEFKYKTEIEDQETYRNDVRFLARLAGVESYLDRPLEKPNGLFTYHNNLGRRDGEYVMPIARAVNYLHYLRFIELGKGAEVESGINNFADLHSKGLVHYQRDGYFELREHLDPFDTETQAAALLLRQNDHETLETLSREISSRLALPKVFDYLLETKPAVLYSAIAFSQRESDPRRISLKDPRIKKYIMDQVDICLSDGYSNYYNFAGLWNLLGEVSSVLSVSGRDLRREAANRFQQALDFETARKLQETMRPQDFDLFLRRTYGAADPEKQRLHPDSVRYFSFQLDSLNYSREPAFSVLVDNLSNPFLIAALISRLKNVKALNDREVLIAGGVLDTSPTDESLLAAIAQRRKDTGESWHRVGLPRSACDALKAAGEGEAP